MRDNAAETKIATQAIKPPIRWFPRSSSVPLHRRWVIDIMHFGRKAHVVGGDLVINVAVAAAARKTRRPSISWVAIWIRAVGIASERWPELRTAYLPLPWPRLYVHPFSVVAVAVERRWRGARAVFFDTIKGPEHLGLRNIDLWFGSLLRLPIENVGAFRLVIRISKLPQPFRRMLWALAARWSGRLRSKYLGTVAINSLGTTRFSVMQTTTPASFAVFFGRVNLDGLMRVQIFCDHRIVDALDGSRIIRDIERIINTEIANELASD